MPKSRNIAVALQLDAPYPQHHDVLDGIQQFARDNPDWRITVDEHPYAPNSRGATARFDGVIARASPQLQRRLGKRGIPLVNTWYQHAHTSTAGVYLDTEKTGRMAADHFLQRQYRQLAFLSVPEFKQAAEIETAYLQRASDENCSFLSTVIENGRFEDQAFWFSTKRLLDRFLDKLSPPTGVFVVVPWIARLLISQCRSRGWGVPRDLAVICLDNVKSIVEMSPQITCMDTNYRRIGYEAASLLDRMLLRRNPKITTIFVPPKPMIPRESTDFIAVDDEVVVAALEYVSKNLSKQLTLERIAKAVFVSPRSLQRHFDAALGRPVTNEIRRLRLEAAKRLLGYKDKTVDQIARSTGFGSANTMNQVFHREVGMSPSAYRKQVIGSQSVVGHRNSASH